MAVWLNSWLKLGGMLEQWLMTDVFLCLFNTYFGATGIQSLTMLIADKSTSLFEMGLMLGSLGIAECAYCPRRLASAGLSVDNVRTDLI